jgi:DNA-binding NtrC family response regulator
MFYSPAEPHAPISQELRELVGESAAMQQLRTQIQRLGPHFRTVLLRGEAGTGKALVARALHGLSSHASGPFLILRCAPDDTGEAALPFDERMAVALKESHRGTLYFDRICMMPAPAQYGLLKALQRRDRARGPIVVHGLEARIIAGSSEDLRVQVATGKFYEELYRRLSMVEIELPPLRERQADLEVLANFFLRRYASRFGKPIERITAEALGRLRSYHWPGNVEELKRRMFRAVVENSGGWIEEMHVASLAPAMTPADANIPASSTLLHEVVEQHVFRVLKGCLGNKVKAAEMLGISRSTLYRMLDAGVQAGKFDRAR